MSRHSHPITSNLQGETQWLTAQYVKAKRPSNALNVREQEKWEAGDVAIAAEPDRKRATIAKEAEKSKFWVCAGR
jgi:hypothetical protein